MLPAGLAVKEGLCYGKAEAAALVLITPLLLLGHLTGIVHGDAERGLLVAFVTFFCIFAARKYTQVCDTRAILLWLLVIPCIVYLVTADFRP